MTIISLLFTLGFSILNSTSLNYYTEFYNWVDKYNKSYVDSDILVNSYKNVVDNIIYIKLQNKTDTTYKIELNHFSDQKCSTNNVLKDYYRNIYGNFEIYDDDQLSKYDDGVYIPEEFDWRNLSGVTKIKDQGSCGDCYAFSALGAIESQYLIHNKVELDLSVSQVVDCSSNYGNDGCEGGLQQNVFDYVIKFGIESTKDYPYIANDNKCKYNSKEGVLKIKDFKYVEPGVESLKKSLVKYGPICISMATPKSFQLYKSGIYSNTQCYKYDVDHAVLLVGFGKFNDEEYWIIKNSWGVQWGESGFARISINYDCDISSVGGSYPIL